MRTFKQFLFIVMALGGLTLGVSAQKGGQKPPKEKPPKIEPAPKKDPPPKGGGRPNKPGMAFVEFKVEEFNAE